MECETKKTFIFEMDLDDMFAFKSMFENLSKGLKVNMIKEEAEIIKDFAHMVEDNLEEYC